MKTFNEFAKEIGLNRQQLNNIINFSDKFYNSYYMEKKKKGETRPIDCPNAQLKTIQRWLLRNFFENIKVNFRANGFIKKRGIKRNAQFHRDMKFILCMDIKNFFSSIKIKDIYRILREEINDTELARVS
jgi:DNA-binding XRE family transcriptional regulator